MQEKYHIIPLRDSRIFSNFCQTSHFFRGIFMKESPSNFREI